MRKKSGWLLIIFVLIVIVWMQNDEKQNNYDEDGSQETKIELNGYTSLQEETLWKTAKIWGLMKYYSPNVTKGKVNWDEALIEILPTLLEQRTQKAVNETLFNWSVAIDEELQNTENVSIPKKLNWVDDNNLWGEKLSRRLVSYLAIKQGKSYYYTLYEGKSSVISQNEYTYSYMKGNDDGYKIISLFRFWNAMYYLYPYHDLIDKDWDRVFYDHLKKFIEADDELSYGLAIFDAIGEIQDAHGTLAYFENRKDVKEFFGKRTAPVIIKRIENQVVVTRVLEDSAKEKIHVGDILVAVNGVEIEVIINKLRRNQPMIRENLDRSY
ncbi:MAG: hypothetical protein ACRCWQ_07365, partial [Bacilli bacterium]